MSSKNTAEVILGGKCIYYILNMFISTYMEGTYVIKEYSRSNSWR